MTCVSIESFFSLSLLEQTVICSHGEVCQRYYISHPCSIVKFIPLVGVFCELNLLWVVEVLPLAFRN